MSLCRKYESKHKCGSFVFGQDPNTKEFRPGVRSADRSGVIPRSRGMTKKVAGNGTDYKKSFHRKKVELAYCCQKPLLLAGLRRWVRFVSVGPLGSSTTRTVRPPIVRTTVRTTARTTSATTPPFARRCLGLAPESRFYRFW